jgi:hypothetical protein
MKKLGIIIVSFAGMLTMAHADFASKAFQAAQQPAQNVEDRINRILDVGVDQGIGCIHRTPDGAIYRRHSNAKLNGKVTDQTDINNFNTLFFPVQEGQFVRYQLNGQSILAQVILNDGQANLCFLRALDPNVPNQ